MKHGSINHHDKILISNVNTFVMPFHVFDDTRDLYMHTYHDKKTGDYLSFKNNPKGKLPITIINNGQLM